jgi:hypothetical protein
LSVSVSNTGKIKSFNVSTSADEIYISVWNFRKIENVASAGSMVPNTLLMLHFTLTVLARRTPSKVISRQVQKSQIRDVFPFESAIIVRCELSESLYIERKFAIVLKRPAQSFLIVT